MTNIVGWDCFNHYQSWVVDKIVLSTVQYRRPWDTSIFGRIYENIWEHKLNFHSWPNYVLKPKHNTVELCLNGPDMSRRYMWQVETWRTSEISGGTRERTRGAGRKCDYWMFVRPVLFTFLSAIFPFHCSSSCSFLLFFLHFFFLCLRSFLSSFLLFLLM